MPRFHVRVAYRTKRESACCGMHVKAMSAGDAIEIAKDHILKGRPARKLAWADAGEPMEGARAINEDAPAETVREIAL